MGAKIYKKSRTTKHLLIFIDCFAYKKTGEVELLSLDDFLERNFLDTCHVCLEVDHSLSFLSALGCDKEIISTPKKHTINQWECLYMLHRCYICQITPFHNSRKPRISSFCCRFVTFRKNKKHLILFSPYNINIITNFARKSIESFIFFVWIWNLKLLRDWKPYWWWCS